MKYILSHARLTKSSRPLAEEISRIVGERIGVFKEPQNPNLHIPIIRYGNSSPTNTQIEYNRAEHIRLAGNKASLSNFLSRNDGEEEKLPHLEIYYRNGIEENEFPIVVRTELNRGGGIGMVFCENSDQFRQYEGNAWTHYYPFKFELGVHILGGKIARVFKKIRNEGLPEERFPRRNTNNGYTFSRRDNWEQTYTGLQEFVNNLYKLIPIKFARLDVGYEKETGGYRLIEINSAPDLSQNQNTLNLYATFLARELFT